MTAAGNRLATLLLQQHAIFLRRESSISRGSTPGNHQRSRRSGEILFITLNCNICYGLLRLFLGGGESSFWQLLSATKRLHQFFKRVASIVWCYKMQPTLDWKFMAHLKCTLIYIRTVKHLKCMAFFPPYIYGNKMYLQIFHPDDLN